MAVACTQRLQEVIQTWRMISNQKNAISILLLAEDRILIQDGEHGL
jgi:hypothetical protein